MMTMKRYIKIAVLTALMAGGLASCQEPLTWNGPEDPAKEGYVNVSFAAAVPDMSLMLTKVVDPDGMDVSNMTLFCFNDKGLFISTVRADLVGDSGNPSLSGSYEASIPTATDRIHFLANQNMSLYDETDFLGKTEAEVLSVMEGSSGMMIYWARVTKGTSASMKTALESFQAAPDMRDDNNDGVAETLESEYPQGTVVLTRNHARTTVNDSAVNASGVQYLDVTGFVMINTSAFGTIAPFSPDGEWKAPSLEDKFVTLPVNDARLSDITDVTNISSLPDRYQYVFETENSSENPVEVIIKGKPLGSQNEKYYRVTLMDTEDQYPPVMRNFTYEVIIAGVLDYGQDTFEAALTAPASNNVWLSVSDDISEVRSSDYSLAVEHTSVVLSKEDITRNPLNKYVLHFTVKDLKGGDLTDEDKPEITWLSGNTVAKNGLTVDFVTSGTSSEVTGDITVELLPLETGDVKREGTLLLKLGPLQRKIKIITINTMSFVPSWVSTEVYSTTAGANMTMMFTIPEDCPEELFPMEVLVSVNDLDVRSASGQVLPIRLKGSEGYDPDGVDDTNDNGYKYVYTAEGPGVQRLYLESILNQTNGTGNITVEAAFFTPSTKTYTFSPENRYISLVGFKTFNFGNTDSPDYIANDEAIYYRLVPQKVNANVQIDMNMSSEVGANDEFLLYSSYLSHYEDGEEDKAGVQAFDCSFYPMDQSKWSTGGRLYMFKPRTSGGTEYSVYMRTNTPKSAEVVRIASNQPGSPSGLGGTYGGNTYRSITFELANYRPYRFHASVAADGGSQTGDIITENTTDAPEAITHVNWTYKPAQEVDLQFDITAFTANDNTSVDPFGTSFEVYIDAPMLEIDDSRRGNLTDAKFYKHPDIDDRFVYVVDASRTAEAAYGVNSFVGNRQGERKSLPFKTKKIVSAGDIVISADPSVVTYHSKTIRVANSSITGTAKYLKNGTETDVQAGDFMPMERVSDNTRIGSVSVTAAGQYQMRLRGEYNFLWTDQIQFEYTDGSQVYTYTTTLAELFNNPNIVLK